MTFTPYAMLMIAPLADTDPLFGTAFASGPLRWFGAGVALFSLFLWVASAVVQWDRFDPRSQRITVAISFLLLSITYGLVEAARLEVEPGPRTYLIVVALIGVAGALAYGFGQKVHNANDDDDEDSV